MKLSVAFSTLLLGGVANAKTPVDFGRQLQKSDFTCPEPLDLTGCTNGVEENRCSAGGVCGGINLEDLTGASGIPTEDGSLGGAISGDAAVWDSVLGGNILATLPPTSLTGPGTTDCPAISGDWSCQQVCVNGSCGDGEGDTVKTAYGYAVFGTFCDGENVVIFGFVLRTDGGDWASVSENNWFDLALSGGAKEAAEGDDASVFKAVNLPDVDPSFQIGFAFKYVLVSGSGTCLSGRVHYNDGGDTIATSRQSGLDCFLFPLCLSEPSDCGNGMLDSGETCDGTPSNCRAPTDQDACTYCGDEIVQPGSEECDPNAPRLIDGQPNPDYIPNCNLNCTENLCGNGNLDAGETCDPARAEDVDKGCRPFGSPNQCTYCGDNEEQGNEGCDGGPDCDASCQPIVTDNAVCGDKVITFPEECEKELLDGTTDPNCDDNCKQMDVQPFCGDGTLNVDETCELKLPDKDDSISCRDGCTYCGDNKVNGPETCEPGLDDTIACRHDCTYCGDGNVDPDESCDPEDVTGPDSCRDTGAAMCTFCGDEHTDEAAGETCDPPNFPGGTCDENCCDVCIDPVWSAAPPSGSSDPVCGSDVPSVPDATYTQACFDTPQTVQGVRTKSDDDYLCGGMVSDTWSICDGKLSVTRVTNVEDNDPTVTVSPGHKVYNCPTDVNIDHFHASLGDDCTVAAELALSSPNQPDVTSLSCGATGSLEWIATDECGNTGNGVSTYAIECCTIVFDAPPPELTVACGEDIPETSVTASVWCNGHETRAATVARNKTGSFETCGDQITYDWTITDGGPDGCAATPGATASQTITVKHTEAPIITADEKDSAFTCAALVDLGATAEDFCGNVLDVTDATLPDTILCSADVTLSWGVQDECENDGALDKAVNICCEFPISTAFSGPDFNVNIRIEVIPGGVRITAIVADPDIFTGDLRGVFFHVDDSVDLDTVTIVSETDSYVIGPRDSVQAVAKDVRMNGEGNIHKYDIGVEIGSQGIGKDDFQTYSFDVLGVSFEDVNGGEFGVRLTSVGPPGNREQSSKVTGYSTCCIEAPEPAPTPEPPANPTPTPATCEYTCPGSTTTVELSETVQCPAPDSHRTRRLGAKNSTPLFL